MLAETHDPAQIEQRFEAAYAEDEWYRHLYRTSYAYHGVHPFYMWYWGAHALEHLGDVIFVGGDPAACRRMGFRRADTLRDALEMAEQVVGRDPTLTHFHCPPLFYCEVDAVKFASGGRTLERLAGGSRPRAERTPRRWRTVRVGPDPWGAGDIGDLAWLRGDRPAHLREALQLGLLFPATRFMARPRVIGAADLMHAPQPAVLAPNHESDIDTPLVLLALPRPWRTRTVVGAASDRFYRRRRSALMSGSVDQHVPVRPRRRAAARTGERGGAPARRPQRAAVPAGHPRRRPRGLPHGRRRARAVGRRADRPDPRRRQRPGDAEGRVAWTDGRARPSASAARSMPRDGRDAGGADPARQRIAIAALENARRPAWRDQTRRRVMDAPPVTGAVDSRSRIAEFRTTRPGALVLYLLAVAGSRGGLRPRRPDRSRARVPERGGGGAGPPAGLGLAVLYLYGLRLWPGIVIGDRRVGDYFDPARHRRRSDGRQHARVGGGGALLRRG